ncbi:MAG TPA: PfkB family carbohydrate kinase [Solirubrobacteraceae bacterium]
MRTLLLGECLVDLVCERPVASLAEATAFVPHFGGAVANVAVVAARGGADVTLAGGAGDDAWGSWLRARLEHEGVDLTWWRLVEDLQTPLSTVIVDAEAQPTFAIYGDAIGATIEAVAPLLDEAVDACDALFLASNTLVGEPERALTTQARERALAHDKPVVFDANLRLGRWPAPARAASVAREFVDGCFLVKANAEEARLLTGESEPAAAAEALLAGGARNALVTNGAGGAVLRGGGQALDVPGVSATPVNTTGAGDTFSGVVLARLAATGYYEPAIGAALGDAVTAAARATEHWGAVGV